MLGFLQNSNWLCTIWMQVWHAQSLNSYVYHIGKIWSQKKQYVYGCGSRHHINSFAMSNCVIKNPTPTSSAMIWSKFTDGVKLTYSSHILDTKTFLSSSGIFFLGTVCFAFTQISLIHSCSQNFNCCDQLECKLGALNLWTRMYVTWNHMESKRPFMYMDMV